MEDKDRALENWNSRQSTLPEAMYVAGEHEFFRRTGGSISSITLEAVYNEMRALDPVLAEALEAALPWVEEWAELSDYPPGKAEMRAVINRARVALRSITAEPGEME